MTLIINFVNFKLQGLQWVVVPVVAEVEAAAAVTVAVTKADMAIWEEVETWEVVADDTKFDMTSIVSPPNGKPC